MFKRALTLILALSPLALVAADCHQTKEERRVVTRAAFARNTNPLISGRYDVASMRVTDFYAEVPKSVHLGERASINHAIDLPQGANDVVQSVEVLVWMSGPLNDSGDETSNDTIEYRLSSPAGTTTGWRPYGSVLKVEGPVNVLRFLALFDNEDPSGIWTLDLLDRQTDGAPGARYINSIVRVNEGLTASAVTAPIRSYQAQGDTLDALVEQDTNGVIQANLHLTNTFNVPEVGLVRDVSIEFALFSSPSSFSPEDLRIMLIAPSGDADILTLTDDYQAEAEGVRGGSAGAQQTEFRDVAETIDAGETIGDFSVAVLTSGGSLDTAQDTGSVTLSVEGGRGTLSGNTTVDVVDGVATFSGLRYVGGSGGEILRLRASATGVAITSDALSPEIGVESANIQVSRYRVGFSDTLRGEVMNGPWRVVMWDTNDEGTPVFLGSLELSVDGYAMGQ